MALVISNRRNSSNSRDVSNLRDAIKGRDATKSRKASDWIDDSNGRNISNFRKAKTTWTPPREETLVIAETPATRETRNIVIGLF
jgi:hypothetical protein